MFKHIYQILLSLAVTIAQAQAQVMPEVSVEENCAPITTVPNTWLLEAIDLNPTWSNKVIALLQANGLKFRQSTLRHSRFLIQGNRNEINKIDSGAKKAWGESTNSEGEETVWVESVGQVRACGSINLPSDPLLPQQWWWQNTGQDIVPWSSLFPLKGRPGSDVQVAKIWPSIATASHAVTVGLIDTGVDFSHPDLNGSLLPGKNLISPDPAVLPQDDNGHGTLMAGIITASTNNSLGIAGLAPNAKILPVKALDSAQLGYISDIVEGIDYLIKQQVSVISISWTTQKHSKSLRAAIIRALKANILVVVSAGNGYINLDEKPIYPASYNFKLWSDRLLVVTASDSWDFLHPISNFGHKSVDLAAPGGAVLSTYPVTLAGDLPPYAFSVGSSAAAAVVSGAAAAVKSLTGLTAKQLKLRLVTTADPVSNLSNKLLSGGRLNIAAASGLIPTSAPSSSGKNKWKTLPKIGASKCSCTVNGTTPPSYDYCLVSQFTPFYNNDMDLRLRLSCNNVKQIRLEMVVDIEPLHDMLFLNSGAGELGVDLVSGNWKLYRSVAVPGDTVELNLRSDNITVGKGFRIKAIQIVK